MFDHIDAAYYRYRAAEERDRAESVSGKKAERCRRRARRYELRSLEFETLNPAV
ncbi:hypothetical protein [Novosphingobium sp. BL-52-GroH]|uniref:hypothetical protein n=1 Tax=Novosphingobium sp. BL-52-GroH TaxID=3349877 RepID=UPI00384F8351